MTDDPTTHAAISIAGLRHAFGSSEVLCGIDLTIEPGQVFGYIGPNGAGKSTTVKILVGMLTGFSGQVVVDGVDVRLDPVEVKRRVGYVPENAPLYDALTVSEFLLFVGRLRSMQDERVLARAHELLDLFELAGRFGHRIGGLSKGMRQKVLITSALLHDPSLVVFDEPLSGLDVGSTMIVKELIAALADQGRTVFYCSHMMDVVERVCDRIAVIDKGVVVADGSFAELSSAASGGSLERVFAELTGTGDARARVRRVFETPAGDGVGG